MNLLKCQGLPTVEIARTRSVRTLVDTTEVSLLAKMPGKVYGLTAAAKTIGISAAVFYSLKKNGDFHASRLPRGMTGFHEADIKAFVERLVSNASQQSLISDGTQRAIRLESIMQRNFCTVEVKADIIRGLLNGSLAASGCNDRTVSGILIPVSAIGSLARRTFGNDTRGLFTKAAPAAKDGERRMSAIDAAALLKCSQLAVLRLLGEGYLQGEKLGNMWLIEERVLHKFSKTYVQVVSVANELRTSPRGLTDFCVARGIPTVSPGRGGKSGTQSFIRVKDKPTLVAFNTYLKSRTLRQRSRRLALAA